MPPHDGSPTQEAKIKKLVSATANRHERLEANVEQLAISNKNMKMQLGQIANAINSYGQGNLPSKIEVNLKEHYKVITLRSRKQIGQVREETEIKDETKTKEVSKKVDKIADKTYKSPPPLTIKPYVLPIPFPQRLKQNKLDKQFEKFL